MNFSSFNLLIVSGMGSFCHAILKRFLSTNIPEICIFSRDEKKQDDMRKHYKVIPDKDYTKQTGFDSAQPSVVERSRSQNQG